MKLDEAFRHLKSGFESGRPAQAIVVSGAPRAEGQALAEMVLEVMYCTMEKKGCGHCRSCEQVKKHTHPDILWIEPQKKSRKISIEQVRVLQSRMSQTSYFNGWKACVLVGADRLGVEASNAFLKTLEEPSGKSIFFLLTDSPQFLLSTIVSRCQRITLSADQNRLPSCWHEPLFDILTEIRPEGKSATLSRDAGDSEHAVAAFARADRIVRLLQEVYQAAKAEESELASSGALEEDNETLDARINSRYREMRTEIVRSILSWYRDILLLLCGAEDALIYNEKYLNIVRKKAESLTYRQALNNVAIVEAMNRQLEKHLPEGSVLSFGFSRLK